ncbi:hypothetical protein CYMTET_46143 [Cymbomonas tetramitiformis]|uniref:Uncharacterized protein n=1 Tax=Cymbomonas tetramitiformis TaxID=36881 RepID=A0AAE0EXW2_9CHLO|nr:hypothetical protein CYMTET_46143 [Cymbomonas tetramitiformis]
MARSAPLKRAAAPVPQSYEDGAHYLNLSGYELQQVQMEVQAGVKTMDMQGTQIIWQKPYNPVGVLFLAHGCSHKATDFWPKSTDCPDCLGLPEEVRITQASLASGLLVMAISSWGKCWDTNLKSGARDSRPYVNNDLENVVGAIQMVQKLESAETLPIFALGASSGGAFVSILPHRVKLQALCVMISGLEPDTLETAVEGGYPQTLFVHMQRDEHTMRAVARSIVELKKLQVRTADIVVLPQNVESFFFYLRIESITQDLSARMVSALTYAGLTGPTGILYKDPRGTMWREAIKQHAFRGKEMNLPLENDRSAISEEMNVAYARHEITADFMDLVIPWMFGNRSLSCTKRNCGKLVIS